MWRKLSSGSCQNVGAGKLEVASERRRDLQGVRALAVLLVALNHAHVPFLRGGYVGVDVFFVLSGYFITTLLMREGLGYGRISIPNFYARRARRILPAAALTLALTSIAVFVVYDLMRADFPDTKSTLLDSLAASLFYANIHFAANATNYFAQASSTMPSPVQHFWSLSVEEQFYLVWPSLLALIFLISRRRDHRVESVRPVRVVGVVIAAVFVLSLLWSIHDTSVDPQAAYFSPFDRVWELGLGAGVALLVPLLGGLPGALRMPLGWVGLGMVLAAALLYSSHTAFPGDAALLPVLGAALIILAGLHPTRRGVDGVLRTRPMAYIGDRSYTFYLWHYPVLIIVWQAAGRVLPVTDNLALLVAAFALSITTYRFYENPLRYARFLRGWRTAAMVPVSLGASVAVIMVSVFAFQASLAEASAPSTLVHVKPLTLAPGQTDPTNLWSAQSLPQVVTAAEAVKRGASLPKAFVPSISNLDQENSDINYEIPRGCEPSFGPGVTSKVCRLADSSSKRVVVLFGDSHAQMWTPALIAVGRKQGFAVVPMVKPGCFVSRLSRAIPGWPCPTWYHWALTQVKALHPIATIVSFKLGNSLMEHAGSTVAAMRAVLTSVPGAVYLADTPDNLPKPAQCITQPDATMRSCSAAEPRLYPAVMRDLSQMANRLHDPAIPTIQWFCADKFCPTIINHTLVTHDGDHLTTEYSTDLGPLLGGELQPILGARSGASSATGAQASLKASGSVMARTYVTPLVAGGRQTNLTNLWTPNPLPGVLAAAGAVKRNAALPAAFVPSMATLGQENDHIAYEIPPGCEPTFGSGATSDICPLGDASSKRVVVVFGDSHAQMWTPGLIAAGDEQGFAVVPIVKPGCLLGRLSTSTSAWPCGTWYQWALQQVKALNPIATIVSFRIGNELMQHASSTITELRQVLSSVPNPILLAATPDNLPKPAQCLTTAGATMRSCSAAEPRLYTAMMRDLAQLARQLHDPAIPTVQWFCADNVCPAIVDHTLVTHDGSHLTIEYSADLGPLLGTDLQPILDARSGASSP